MFGNTSGFCAMRHICNAEELAGQAGLHIWVPKIRAIWTPVRESAPPMASQAVVFWPRDALVYEVLTRPESGTRTSMHSDRHCVFSALEETGPQSVWLGR